jgi:exocyst complex component 8
MPKIEPVPTTRRRGAVTPLPTIQTKLDDEPPPPQMDTLAPPPSAFLSRSNPLSPSLLSAPLSNASYGSGYSSTSNYSNITAAVGALSASFDLPPHESTHAPVSATPLRTPHSATVPSRTRTPISGAPPRVRTPVSGAPPREGMRSPLSARPHTPLSARPHTPLSARPHTPVSAAPGLGARTPLSGLPRTPASGLPPATPLSASVPPSERRPRSPQLRPDRDQELEHEGEHEGDGEEDWILKREKSLRAMRGGANPAPPSRSTNRPGSSSGIRPPPVAVPVREGMI